MKPTETHGAFSWAELMTGDAEAAVAFYDKILPWNSQEMPMEGQEGNYNVQMLGESPAAGITDMPMEGVPTVWGYYVTVDDVDATVEKALSLGAATVWGPFDIPNVGRMAGLTDPQGAYFSLITYLPMPEGTSKADFMSGFTTPGRFSWYSLQTSDPEAAKAFYSEVFGWNYQTQEMATGPYTTIQVGEVGQGGVMPLMQEGVPPHWAAYITVEDCDATLEAAAAAGGTTLFGPMDIPTVGRTALIQDPTGGRVHVIAYVPMEEPA